MTTDGTTDISGDYPIKSISAYKIMGSWGTGKLSEMPPDVNVVRLAFAHGNPLLLDGWGAQGEESFLSDVMALRERGVKFLVSVGGQGGEVDTADTPSFLSGIDQINSQIKLDGLDWDIEASKLNQAQVLSLFRQLKEKYGRSFAITFVPGGHSVAQYLPTAVACHKEGLLDEYGQQFYDVEVSLNDVLYRIREAQDAGLPLSKISVSMKIDDLPTAGWTNGKCLSNMRAIREQYPEITKAYLWESSRAGTAEWACDMECVISLKCDDLGTGRGSQKVLGVYVKQ